MPVQWPFLSVLGSRKWVSFWSLFGTWTTAAGSSCAHQRASRTWRKPLRLKKSSQCNFILQKSVMASSLDVNCLPLFHVSKLFTTRQATKDKPGSRLMNTLATIHHLSRLFTENGGRKLRQETDTVKDSLTLMCVCPDPGYNLCVAIIMQWRDIAKTFNLAENLNRLCSYSAEMHLRIEKCSHL